MQLRVKDIRDEFVKLLKEEQFVTDKTGVKTIELIGQSFLADEPLIFGSLNDDYIQRELNWYNSQSLSVFDIPGKIPQIWKQIASNGGLINSNYGYLIYSHENGNQYVNVRAELERNPDSRRATMVYQRPSIWTDYNKDGMSDFICTNAVSYFIRNSKLRANVQMRSNDVIFGFRNDFAWARHVLEKLAKDLNVIPGDITWNASSLHVYSRHFHLVK